MLDRLQHLNLAWIPALLVLACLAGAAAYMLVGSVRRIADRARRRRT